MVMISGGSPSNTAGTHPHETTCRLVAQPTLHVHNQGAVLGCQLAVYLRQTCPVRVLNNVGCRT